MHGFDLEKAKQYYQNCFVPLLYHELWVNTVNEYASLPDIKCPVVVEIQNIENSFTLDKQEQTAILLGTYSTVLSECSLAIIQFVLPFMLFLFLDDPLAVLSHRLVMFDLVLITIGQNRHFGIVLHVDINEIATDPRDKSIDQNKFHINLMTTVGIYVSDKCATAFKDQSGDSTSKRLEILKITNIKSIRSMINAIYDLGNWPQRRSILKPTREDPYFQLPEGFDPKNSERIPGFNPTQSKVIRIAQFMDDDIQERLHMVHGPPGKRLLYH